MRWYIRAVPGTSQPWPGPQHPESYRYKLLSDLEVWNQREIGEEKLPTVIFQEQIPVNLFYSSTRKPARLMEGSCSCDRFSLQGSSWHRLGWRLCKQTRETWSRWGYKGEGGTAEGRKPVLSRLLSDIPCQAARGSEGAPSPHIFKIWISNPDDRLKNVL